MSWFLVSPGHQQSWYWLCWIKKWEMIKKCKNTHLHISLLSFPVQNIRNVTQCWPIIREIFLAFIWGQLDWIMLKISILDMSLKITNLGLQMLLPGTNELKQATGLDAWASRVKCPARFVSHLHEICIYIWVVYSLCFFCCLFITVTWWYVWCFVWASGNQEEVQACLVTLWLFIISCYSLYKTTLGLLCSWFENNPHFHKYSMDFNV